MQTAVLHNYHQQTTLLIRVALNFLARLHSAECFYLKLDALSSTYIYGNFNFTMVACPMLMKFHQILPSGKQADGHLSFGHSVFGAWTPSHPWKTEAGVIAAGGDALTSQLPWARLPDYLTDMQNVRLLLHISVLSQEGGLKGRKSEQEERSSETQKGFNGNFCLDDCPFFHLLLICPTF